MKPVKVLIVAKTRQGSAACVGGISAEGRSVRLIAHDVATNEHAGMQYEIGDVWDICARPADHVIPPHVENVIVHAGRRLSRADDPTRAILKFMPPVIGGPDRLFESLVQTAESGALYIAESAGIPSFSTGFWQPDRSLQRVETRKRIRYCYDGPSGERSLVFVGFQDPPPVIEAGALVRVSLAHWWRSPDHLTTSCAATCSSLAGLRQLRKDALRTRRCPVREARRRLRLATTARTWMRRGIC
jgi:ATP-dependent DNA helicase RecQ